MTDSLHRRSLDRRFSRLPAPLPARPLNIVFIGLSITSSWGNGHAYTYRCLLPELQRRGHRVRFLEREQAWYAANRDLPHPRCCELGMYEDFQDLASRFEGWIEEADCVVIGSYVPDGAGVAEWVTQTAPGVVAFFDLDTPSTLQELADGTCEYLDGSLIPTFDLILSFTGGPTLNLLASRYGAQRAQPFYASIDPAACTPSAEPPRWDLGYLGTYCADRQEALHRLLIQTARRGREFSMAVAGSHYPVEILWPTGVERIHYLAPHQHAAFYTAQRFALQITRAARRAAGFTPSVRLFEAAACGTPVITDAWSGLETFFIPGREILLAENADDVLRILRDTPESERRAIGERARRRVLQHHTASHRAELLERLICEIQPRVTGRILTAV